MSTSASPYCSILSFSFAYLRQKPPSRDMKNILYFFIQLKDNLVKYHFTKLSKMLECSKTPLLSPLITEGRHRAAVTALRTYKQLGSSLTTTTSVDTFLAKIKLKISKPTEFLMFSAFSPPNNMTKASPVRSLLHLVLI